MNYFTQRFRNKAIYPTLVVTILLTVMAWVMTYSVTKPTVSASQLPPASVLHLVRNNTTNLRVISADILHEGQTSSLRLTFKNTSPDKRLTAYVLSADDPQAWLEQEFLYSENPADIIEPGAIFTDTIGGIEPNKPIVILCAIFGAKDFEGERKQAGRIINARFGRKLFLTMALPDLHSLQQVGAGDERTAKCQAIRGKLLTLTKPNKSDLAPYLSDLIEPMDKTDTLERQIGSGFEFGKNYVLQRLGWAIEKRQGAITTRSDP
jgi:hypothetical protein